MKTTIKTAWLLLSSIFLLAACSDDRDGNPVIQHPSTFVLDTPAYASSTVTLASTDSLAFSWVQPAFGYQAKVDYQLQISFTGNFTVSTDEAKADASGTTVANYTELPTVYSVTQAKLSAKAFAQTLQTFGNWTNVSIPANQTVYVRIKAAYANVDTLFSNTIKLEVVPYYVAEASTLFLTGSAYGWGGTWKELIPVNGTAKTNNPTFWTLLYLSAGEEFKLAPTKAWVNDFGYTGTTINDLAGAGVSDNGGNIKVSNAGWYLLKVVNGATRSVDFLAPKVYLFGATANDTWSAGTANLFTTPTTPNGEFVSPAFSTSGAVRMCVVLDGFDWWKSEFVLSKEGKIVYRGDGGDMAAVNVTAGEKAYLKFADGTGEYK